MKSKYSVHKQTEPIYQRQLSSKSQSAIEFITVISIVLVFFILILVLLSQQAETVGFQGTDQYASLLSNTIDREIQLAKTIDGAYSRVFTLPEEIDGNYFTVDLYNGRELRITDESGATTLKFLTGFVCGEIGIGTNEIIKKGSTIGICPGSCNNTLPCVSTGEIQCALQENAWATCAPKYDDVYAQMRVYCPEAGTAELNITNIDDDLILYGESSGIFDTYATFEPDFTVNESGDYLFEVTCTAASGTPTSYAREYFVPYGEFVVRQLFVSGCLDVGNAAYNCTADTNFTIGGEILCQGGECGDAQVWLDPQ